MRTIAELNGSTTLVAAGGLRLHVRLQDGSYKRTRTGDQINIVGGWLNGRDESAEWLVPQSQVISITEER